MQHSTLPYTNAFQVRQKVNPPSDGKTTVYTDSAASSHMVSDESCLSKDVVEKSDLQRAHHRIVWHV